MLHRSEGWPAALMAHLRSRRRAPFQWGTHDCALFAMDGVLSMTGTDLAAWFRGRYADEAGARAAIAAFAGGGTLESVAEMVAAREGLPETAVSLAQRGDIVLLDNESDGRWGPALGLCVGASAAFAARPEGIALVGMTRIRRAWRV